MKYRKFKEVQVAEIGLGTWQLGSLDWGVVDEKEGFAILSAYVNQGGNFIDTADVYGMGISESLIGKFLKENAGREIFVATKLGRRQDKENGWPANFTYTSMRNHVETSLDHLQQSQLFLEQLHCIPTEEMKSGKVFDHLRRLQQEKLIRYWGASVETAEEALMCIEQEGIASLQIIFNLFRQHIADEIFQKAQEKDIAIIVRVPLASGLLTGKFSEKTIFPEQDHRNYNANGESFNAGETFAGVAFDQGVQFSRELAKRLPDERMAQWSLRWILDHPQVTTVIPGASKTTQVQLNVAASELPSLPAAVKQDLRAYYDEKIFAAIRGRY